MALRKLRLSKSFLVLGCTGWVLPVLAETVDDIAETRANMQEVVELRETLSNETRAWREQKNLMEGQIRLDRVALEQLEAELERVQPQITALTIESSQLKLDLEEARQVIDFWKEKLTVLKTRLSKIVRRFPPGFRNQLLVKLQDAGSIHFDEHVTSLKRVLDLCLEIIAEANDYHGKIHHLTEVHDLPDGRRGEFNVIYLGLSGGYYYSEGSSLAGTIQWRNDQWEWVEDSGLFEELVQLGAVVSGQEPPRYLSIPLQFNRKVEP